MFRAVFSCIWRVLSSASGGLGFLISAIGTLLQSADKAIVFPGWAFLAVGALLLFITAIQIEWELLQEKEKRRKPAPTMSLEAVVKRIRGKEDIFGPENSESAEVLRALTLIRERAANGSLTIFGSREARYVRPEHHATAISRMPIPKEFWLDNTIDYIAFTTNRDGITKMVGKPNDRSNEYEYLWLDKHEVDTIWPPPRRTIRWRAPIEIAK